MSFDIHLLCCRNGQASAFAWTVAEAIFDRGALSPSEMACVEYTDGRGEIYGCEDAMIEGFMLSHFSGRTICERLLEIASVTQSLIFWPSLGIQFAVTDPAHLAHVPREGIEDRYIAVVRTVDELWAAINTESEPPPNRAGAG